MNLLLFFLFADLSLYTCNVILFFFLFGAEALLQPAGHPSVAQGHGNNHGG